MTPNSVLTTLTPAQLARAEARVAAEGWLRRSVSALDIFCNVLFLRGLPDETISSHSARACLEGKTWGCLMSRFLNVFQSDHGELAIAGDLERGQAVAAVEEKFDGQAK